MNNIPLVSCQVISSKNVPATTSLKIAEFTGKEHFIVLRDVENLISEGHISESNFVFSTYQGARRKEKMCVLDEDATTLLLMGYTGKEAMTWKKSYIAEFKRMREENKVKRVRGDDFAFLNQVQKNVADHMRRTLEGKEGHVGYYVSLAKSTNEIAFGYHEKGMRRDMTPEQSLKLGYTLQGSINLMLRGVTNPTQLKEAMSKQLAR